MAEDEAIDIVDLMDRPVRIALRAEAHTEDLPHRCVHILIFRDADHRETLVQQRSQKKPVSPLAWCHSASGHLLAGQTYLAGAIHELDELFHGRPVPLELILNLRKFATFRMRDSQTNNEFVTLYTAVYDGVFEDYDGEELAGPPVYEAVDKIASEIKSDPDKYTLAFRQTFAIYRMLSAIYQANGVSLT